MKPYIISYDLRYENGKSKGYADIAAAIKKTGTWCRPTLSTWIVESHLSAVEIYNFIRPTMDGNDLLFVGELAKDNWVGFVPNTVTILNKILG